MLTGSIAKKKIVTYVLRLSLEIRGSGQAPRPIIAYEMFFNKRTLAKSVQDSCTRIKFMNRASGLFPCNPRCGPLSAMWWFFLNYTVICPRILDPCEDGVSNIEVSPKKLLGNRHTAVILNKRVVCKHLMVVLFVDVTEKALTYAGNGSYLTPI